MREGNKAGLHGSPPARSSSILFVFCLVSIAANILLAKAADGPENLASFPEKLFTAFRR
jgi:hypothetical protein